MTGWTDPVGLYRPGSAPLHRAPAGAKLAGLAVLGLLVVAWPRWQTSLVVLAAVVVLATVARLPWAGVLRGLAPVLVTLAVLATFQVWQRGWQVAVQVCAGLLALVLAGTVVTTTTPVDRMVDLLVRLARPLRRIGLAPEVFALAVALMLRSIPAIGRLVGEVRDAARARGLDRSPRALLVPTALRTVGRARLTGEALAARGVAE